MNVVLILSLLLLGFAALGIWGALHRIADHNERFLPPGAEEPRAGSSIAAGDVIVIRVLGTECAYRVEGLADRGGTLVIGIAPEVVPVPEPS